MFELINTSSIVLAGCLGLCFLVVVVVDVVANVGFVIVVMGACRWWWG